MTGDNMSRLSKITIIIPVLNPSDRLFNVVGELVEVGFSDIIVVNDGSGAAYIKTFEDVGNLPGCTVLAHEKNKGKGAALKTAFCFFLENRTDNIGVVTMDSDGQHRTADVVKCAEALAEPGDTIIMGVRDFNKPNVPRRNAFGNRLTAHAFRLFFGIMLKDTQTGLRGIRKEHLPLVLKINNNRFDYESAMLIEAEKEGLRFHEVEIETVYEKDSKDPSHYRPFADSLLILLVVSSRLVKYALSGISTFFLDIGLFWVIIRFFGSFFGAWAILLSTFFARVFSAYTNFYINRRFVFTSNKSLGLQTFRYFILASVQMCVSAGLLWLLSLLIKENHSAGLLTFLKAIVDTVIVSFSFIIQRKWVFRK